MSTVLLVKCDGTFDGGRMPCRATLPIPAARVRRTGDLDALDEHAAHVLAWEAGWQVPHPDAGGPTLCPAHRRAADRQAQLRMAADERVSPELAERLRTPDDRWRTVLDQFRADHTEPRAD